MEKLKKEADERERLLASRRRKMNQENNRMRTATRQIDQPDENNGIEYTYIFFFA